MSASNKKRNNLAAAIGLAVFGLIGNDVYAAHSFCCNDARNQRQCGDVLPVACRARPYTEYNEAGVQVRKAAAPLTEAQIAAKEAEDKKKRQLAEADEAQRRADTALLSTYADEKDLDTARQRALGEMERSQKSIEENIVGLNKDKTALDKEAAPFNGKPPYQLKRKLEQNQASLTEQQNSLAAKKKEIDETKAKFDGFLKRFRELKQPKPEVAEKP